MADHISTAQLESFLHELGKRYPKPATLYLLGGSALVLLGGSRPTLDIDYVGIDIPGLWNDLQRLIAQLAVELDLKIEAVPYDEMIPPLPDTTQRNIAIGKYGTIQVYVLDPYAMALGKLDRGFPTDLEDVGFLLQREFIEFASLEKMALEASRHAREYDLNPKQMQASLETVRQLLDAL
ncbi:MAG: hypothetical protein HY741_13490 [Chloroflexi bacterium]|nr:hypothetical protein [Chloroflexota bacterium]